MTAPIEQQIELLTVARDRLQAGWQTGELGAWRQPTGRVCSVGAIKWAVYYSNEAGRYKGSDTVENQLISAVALTVTGKDNKSVLRWNDLHPFYWKRGVVRGFNKTIRRLQRQATNHQIEQDLMDSAANAAVAKTHALRLEAIATQVERNIAAHSAAREQIEIKEAFDVILQERSGGQPEVLRELSIPERSGVPALVS